jgi:hypothetical protein
MFAQVEFREIFIVRHVGDTCRVHEGLHHKYRLMKTQTTLHTTQQQQHFVLGKWLDVCAQRLQMPCRWPGGVVLTTT